MSSDIKDLDPRLQSLALKHIDACAMQGIVIKLTSTYRTTEEQDDLYAQGRTKPGSIVTNAKGGQSYHNLRWAYDIVVKTSKGYSYEDESLYNKVGQIGKSIGLEWGGDFPTPDLPHFQKKYGSTISQEDQSVSDTEQETRKPVEPSKEYYEYYHQDSSVKTIQAMLDTDMSIIARFSSKIEDLLKYKGLDNKSNLDRLWENYSETQKNTFSDEYSGYTDQLRNATGDDRKSIYDKRKAVRLTYSEGKDYDINVGTLMYVPKNQANIEVMSMIGKDLFARQQDMKTFMYGQYQKLLNDPSYIPTSKMRIKGSKYSVNYLHVAFNCWIYVRSLGKILNITPFVRDMTTTVQDGGGNFSISLNEIGDDVNKYSETYYSYIHKVRNERYSVSYFNKMIQQNDIVFLRFERLDIEADADRDGNDLEIMESSLAGKVYDMIGLIDSNSEGYGASGNVSSLSISGRDFSKVILEDSCNFFYFALVNEGKDFFLNYNPKDSVFKRLFVNGAFQNYSVMAYRSIRDSLGFIFNQLTNVGILPKESTLFDSWKSSWNREAEKYEDRQSKALTVNGSNKEYLDTVETNGVWKIIQLVVDNQLDDRRLNNGELSSPDGPILSLIQKICMDPFVEFWGDTLGDQYVFMARQAPFTKKQIQDYFDNNVVITIESDQVSDLNLSWEETYYTWYQLQPAEGLFGSGQFVAGTRMPAVYFEEYANLFGMHKKVISDSYLNIGCLNGDQSNRDLSIYRESLAQDLKYVIESNSVLPFTRKGRMILQGGDRRIKKGSWIFFKPTNEIFYVKSVSNMVAINGNVIARTTTIDVERGMLKQFVVDVTGEEIQGKEINGKKVNYFDIINLAEIEKRLSLNLTDNQAFASSATNNNYQVPVSEIGSTNVSPLQVKLAKESFDLSKAKNNNLNTTSGALLVDKDLFEFFSTRKQWQ
jgi:peptidoglycan L-alanyl-D-glutamate endopeptidase CwlK